ncbi:hypothetical protein ACTT2I_16620 [Stenotrophomonas sp. PUT21]|uniref:hypothetical protein n=1 Tax=Stenotrophomonas sp. PUT21 TaxID=3456954 RepID=UPI003FCC8FD8
MNICYYCGFEASTAEHVPPQGIFPRQKDSPDGKDYRKQLITVPSCEEHNTDKSREDEYLLYTLAMSLPSNEVAKHQFLTKIMRAVKRRPKLMERLLTETQEVVVHDTVAGTWEKTIAFRPEESRLIGMFTCIAKGLYFHEKRTPWLGDVSVLIEFMLSFDDLEKNEDQRLLVERLDTFLEGQPLRGNNQDVFGYQFVEADGKVLARLHFYGSSKVTVAFIV